MKTSQTMKTETPIWDETSSPRNLVNCAIESAVIEGLNHLTKGNSAAKLAVCLTAVGATLVRHDEDFCGRLLIPDVSDHNEQDQKNIRVRYISYTEDGCENLREVLIQTSRMINASILSKGLSIDAAQKQNELLTVLVSELDMHGRIGAYVPGVDIHICLGPAELVVESLTDCGIQIRSLARQVLHVMTSLIGNSLRPLREVGLLSDEEQFQVTRRFNSTECPLLFDGALGPWFEAVAEKHGDCVAILTSDDRISYRDLRDSVERRSCYLDALGIREGSVVAVLQPRSLNLIITLLALLRIGAVYVPLDPTCPPNRIQFILEDADISLICCETATHTVAESLTETIPVVKVDVLGPSHAVVPLAASSSCAVAYQIYTSGSTGRPKGVRVTHRNLVNFISAIEDRLRIGRYDRILAVTTVSFDIFFLEAMLPLFLGKTVVLARETELESQHALADLIRDSHVSVVQFTPSRLQLLLSSGEGAALSEVKLLIVGGDAFLSSMVPKVRRHCKAEIWNLYGPTETTVWSTAARVTDPSSITIGSPIGNTQTLVVDEQGGLAPIGVAGELLIGGLGVSDGYWKREDLNAMSFVEEPCGVPGRFYRTGDRCRWLDNGELDFLGRLDRQVKVRGYRVELDEVEVALSSIAGVNQCAVALRRGADAEACLAAFFTGTAGRHDVRDQLQTMLPSYAIPDILVRVEQLPLTPSGKLDRKALSNLDIANVFPFAVPETTTERIMAKLWCEVLHMPRVGRNDDFFLSGGTSMSLMVLIERLYRAFRIDLAPEVILTTPVLRELCALIDSGTFKGHPLVRRLGDRGPVVFGYPPIGGKGLVYQQLQEAQPSLDLTVFDFEADMQEPCVLYSDEIQRVQPEGKHILLGWSAGGNLAYETGLELENRNPGSVAAVILVDTSLVAGAPRPDAKELDEQVDRNLLLAAEDPMYAMHLSDPAVRAAFRVTMRAYTEYLHRSANNIRPSKFAVHQILSEDPLVDDDPRLAWQGFSAQFVTHHGCGSHPYMLYTENLEANGALIARIVDGLTPSEKEIIHAIHH